MMVKLKQISYRHVDVFSHAPLSGNGLTVFIDQECSVEAMQKITQEMRQYESIFLFSTQDPHRFSARIFTMEEELDFAGHPLLGAACVLHEKIKGEEQTGEWTFELRHKEVKTRTIKKGKSYVATMEQGAPYFHSPLEPSHFVELLKLFNLSERDIPDRSPLQVISTGLPYLIIPVKGSLEKIRLASDGLEKRLVEIGAKFAYILDVSHLEGRTWDNAGRAEDIATGSAAGPAAAYLVRHGLEQPNADIIIRQGKFMGRPSQMLVQASGTRDHIVSVQVSGQVCMVAKGTFDPFEL